MVAEHLTVTYSVVALVFGLSVRLMQSSIMTTSYSKLLYSLEQEFWCPLCMWIAKLVDVRLLQTWILSQKNTFGGSQHYEAKLNKTKSTQ